MQKTTILLSLIFITLSAKSQELSYGVLLGGAYSSNASSGQPTFRTNDGFSPQFGAYGEYNFTEKWGIKTEVIFNNKNISAPEGTDEFKFSMITISPNLKLDFGNEYRSGAYIIFGPMLSFITKASQNGVDSSNDFESTLIGAQAGVGCRIASFLDLQFKIDYDFTPFYKNPITKNSDFFIGANCNLSLDFERLINTKQDNSSQ